MINVTLEQIKNWIDCEIDEKHLLSQHALKTFKTMKEEE